MVTIIPGTTYQMNPSFTPDVVSWQWQPPQGLSNPYIANPVAQPLQTTTYVCIASNANGCIARDQVTINIICNSTSIFIPNTFSPNGDGMNDIFTRGQFDYHGEIFAHI